jgi:transcriptional regulator with XRE-family HTH domain
VDKDNQPLCVDIGKKIKDSRKKHDWSVAKLAEMAGLSNQCIKKVEKGETASKITTVYLLCIALGISSDKLLGLDQLDIESTTKAELDAIGLLNQLNATELKYVTNQIKGLLEITRA